MLESILAIPLVLRTQRTDKHSRCGWTLAQIRQNGKLSLCDLRSMMLSHMSLERAELLVHIMVWCIAMPLASMVFEFMAEPLLSCLIQVTWIFAVIESTYIGLQVPKDVLSARRLAAGCAFVSAITHAQALEDLTSTRWKQKGQRNGPCSSSS